MKKILTSIFAALFIMGLVAGCGNGGADKKAEGDKKVEKANLILATGGTSGTYYPLGGAMAQIWNSKSNGALNVTAQSTGAAIENLRLINKGDVELAIVQSDTMDYAHKGTEVFQKEGKLDNVRAIAYLYPEIIQIVVSADSGINSIADLKGKKVGVGAPGSGTEANFRQLIDVYGLTYEDIDEQFLSFSECADRFKDKQIDAFLVVAGIPNSAIMDIATQHDIRVLSMSDEMAKKVNEKYPFLAVTTIPANTYKGQTADTKTVAVMATLVAGGKVKDDVIYSATKILFDNLDGLSQGHAKGKEIKLENATKSITIPFHPGAEKYFKEKGVLK